MLIGSTPEHAADHSSGSFLPEACINDAEPPTVLKEQHAPHDLVKLTEAAEIQSQVGPAQDQHSGSELCENKSQTEDHIPAQEQLAEISPAHTGQSHEDHIPEENQLSQGGDAQVPQAAAVELSEDLLAEQAEKTAVSVTAVGIDHQGAEHPGLHAPPVCEVR